MNKPRLGAWLVLLLAAVLLAGCGRPLAAESAPMSQSQLLLDTVCSITLYQGGDEEALQQAFALAADYESQLSRTAEGGQVWRINQGETVAVSPETAELISLGLDYGRLSGGSFDITVGALTQLWDFGGANHLPTAEELAAALATVGQDAVTVTRAADGQSLVSLSRPGAQLELGAIAKGYIADQTAAFLREQGVTAGVLDFGGNVLTLGEKPDGTAWRIGVQQPFGSERVEMLGLIEITGAASIVTSGVYERNFQQDGVLYHHILDPASGYPAASGVMGVTVVSRSSAQGDALSTICLLLGLEAGSRLLESQEGVAGAVWVDQAGEVYVQGEISFIPASQ